MIRRDVPAVVGLLAGSSRPWREDTLLRHMRDMKTIAEVIEDRGDRVLGVVVYRAFRTGYRVLNVATEPTYRRCGIGLKFMGRLIERARRMERVTLRAAVPESDLASQLFFAAAGFRATGVSAGRIDMERGAWE